MFYVCSEMRESSTLLCEAVPSVLHGTPMADTFRYWKGASGRRYLHCVLPVEAGGDHVGMPAILVAVEPDGSREPVWIGIAGGADYARALPAARMVGACEMHVHLLAEDVQGRRRVVEDLIAAAGGAQSGAGAEPRRG